MVGDALETDITGGKWANIDTLWVVNDGIHAPFVNENKNESFETNVQSILDDFNDKLDTLIELLKPPDKEKLLHEQLKWKQRMLEQKLAGYK